ncbi:Nucleotide exchange factor SIL1 [Paramuricea clavata]|uniref:Nucleotide exchange factor SIL1 n=1 Tax=Paramuricea clavata TaxID=317549 RepID=A0A7D9DSJ0_PARCT|nr:Nucleotide exchange factor SIL1 [Paramuricea clavata]
MTRNCIILFMFVLIQIILSEEIRNKDLVLVPSESTNENEEQERTLANDDTNYDIFHATNQWQTIREDQSIPPGLHVQIDLTTGEKRAKLMDEKTSDGSENNKAQSSQYPTKQKYIKIDKNIISKQKLKDALKDFKDKFHSEDLDDELQTTHEKNKYRSMDEIKQEFEGANIWMKKDIEIIQDLVAKLNSSESAKSVILVALEELEYLVHQIDNARDLDVIGGLALVVNLLNQTDNEIQSQAAYVIGSAAQSNLPVQVSLLESGALQLLTRLLVNTQDSPSTRKKALYALSAMLRLFPKGTQKFLKIGGLPILASLFQENENEPLRIKALTLLVDLLTEQMDSIKKKAKEMRIQDYEKAALKAPLLKAMYQEGWCKLSTTLITTTDTETKEKLLQAFQILLPACRAEWKQDTKLKVALKLWREQWRSEIDRDNQDDTGYLETLVKLADTVEQKCA